MLRTYFFEFHFLLHLVIFPSKKKCYYDEVYVRRVVSSFSVVGAEGRAGEIENETFERASTSWNIIFMQFTS